MSEFKYNEDETLSELFDYIESTYNQHYVGEKDKIQTFDVYESLGSLGTTCRDTAIKYLMRYGRKAGHNKKDLLKAMHYIAILLYATRHLQDKGEPGPVKILEPGEALNPPVDLDKWYDVGKV